MPVVDGEARQNLTVAGRPLSTSLRNVRTLSTQMVEAFVANVAPCGTLPTDVIGGDVTTITRACLQFAVTMLDGQGSPPREDLARLEAAAGEWAREGIPLDTVLRAIHEGSRIGHRLVVQSGTEKDFNAIANAGTVLIDILETVSTTVTMAYLHEHRAVSGEHHTAVHTLTTALMSGHATSTMALQSGMEIAESYCVLALSLPPHPDEANPRYNRSVVARRKLRRVQAELAVRCGGTALSLLSVDGGTVLIPSVFGEDRLGDLVEQLSAAAGVPIVAATSTCAVEAVPDVVDEVHQLLHLVRHRGESRGLHRFGDLALEFQLTRPGPGRRRLAAHVDPLQNHPELLNTLRTHLSNNLNRRVSARQLHIHSNTLDYRLRRIGQLTGLDPTVPTGLWNLHAALVAYDLEHTAPAARGRKTP